MALINCPECGKQVSDKAQFCVHCGYKLEGIRSQEESENRMTVRKENSYGSTYGNQIKVSQSNKKAGVGYYIAIAMFGIGSLLMAIAPLLTYYRTELFMPGLGVIEDELSVEKYTMFNVISQSSGGLKAGETSGLWDVLPVFVMVLGCLGVLITLIEVVRGKSVLRDIPKLILSLLSGALVVIFEIFGLETLRKTEKVLAESMETLMESGVTYEQKKDIGFILLVVGIGIAFVAFIVCKITSKKKNRKNVAVADNSQEGKQTISLKKNDDSMFEQNDVVDIEESKGKKQRKRRGAGFYIGTLFYIIGCAMVATSSFMPHIITTVDYGGSGKLIAYNIHDMRVVMKDVIGITSEITGYPEWYTYMLETLLVLAALGILTALIDLIRKKVLLRGFWRVLITLGMAAAGVFFEVQGQFMWKDSLMEIEKLESQMPYTYVTEMGYGLIVLAAGAGVILLSLIISMIAGIRKK